MYALIKFYGQALIRSFYQVHSTGPAIKDQGAMILVSNHSGGLVDGGLIWFVCQRNPRFIGKYTLFKMPILGHIVKATGAIPIYRKKDKVDTSKNRGSFDAIHAELGQGGTIGMFPEGEGGSSSFLRPFKTGAARMGLGAMAVKDWSLDLLIQPVGIYYADRDRYRSNLFAWRGDPIGFDHLRDLYEQSPIEAAKRATEEIRAALTKCVVQYESPEEAPAMVMAAELIPHKGRLLPERVHSCVAGMRRLNKVAPSRARTLRDGLDKLSTELQQVGIHARDLDNRPGLGATARAGVLLASSFLLRWLIWAAWLPVIVPAQVISRRNAPADKVVTFTIMGASFVSPLWLLGSALWMGSKYGAATSLITVLVLLLAAFSAGPIHDVFQRNLDTLNARFEGGARGERNLRLLALRDHLKRILTRRSGAFDRLNLQQDPPA
jgi:1-acyl-sn-glycerol-3-phosphate acyltransferase